jgi:hypothetical protein
MHWRSFQTRVPVQGNNCLIYRQLLEFIIKTMRTSKHLTTFPVVEISVYRKEMLGFVMDWKWSMLSLQALQLTLWTQQYVKI